MYAETVYTVFSSLSQVEKERFIDIIQQEIKALQQPSKPKKEKKSRVKSKEEYMDIALQLMSSRKRNANKKWEWIPLHSQPFNHTMNGADC